MKSRIFLAVQVGISLALAAILYAQQAVNTKLEKSLAEIENQPKTERDRFHSNAVEFYRHSSMAAHEERKRLRTLFYQIRNDPESDRLEKIMVQYVDWVSRSNDPAWMRENQSKSIDDRVEAVYQAVQIERANIGDPPITIERLKESIRENLAPELRMITLPSLAVAFDDWLTQQYAEAKNGLSWSEDQLQHLPILEKFYRDLFRHAGTEPFDPGIPEKLAMLQLIQNLSSRSGSGTAPGFPRLSGNPRMGGGFVRPGGGPFGGGGLREDFVEQLETDLLQLFDESVRETFNRMNPSARMESLQRMLALAVLEQYPTIDPGRLMQEASRTDQQEWIEIIGVYLSLMSPPRREEFLKQDSRFMLNRLQGELWFNAMAYFGLFGSRQREPRPPDPRPSDGRPSEPRPPDGRPPGMGPPPPPRGDFS
ncbi:MAG: hypothetical protein FWD31_02855 [Planctomycetaceae bacterium]|nr:hypothetical protein [Planctomycetaceae bacterium]